MANQKKIVNWYNDHHLQKGKHAWRPPDAYQVYLDYLKISKTSANQKRLLDIGCGTGYLLKSAQEIGLLTYGIDIAKEGVKIAKEVSPGSTINIGNGENIKFREGYFDYITCIGALEHFINIRKGLKEMKRVGKDNARYCIVVPNRKFLLWKIIFKPGTNQKKINEKLLSLEEWQKIFQEANMKVLKIYRDRWYKKFSSKTGIKNSIKKIVHLALWSILPKKLTYQFVFILK